MNPIVCCVLAAVVCVVAVDAQVYVPDDAHSAVVSKLLKKFILYWCQLLKINDIVS